MIRIEDLFWNHEIAFVFNSDLTCSNVCHLARTFLNYLLYTRQTILSLIFCTPPTLTELSLRFFDLFFSLRNESVSSGGFECSWLWHIINIRIIFCLHSSQNDGQI